MKKVITTIAMGLAAVSFAGGNNQITKREYVDEWSPVAIEQMVQHGIPASITLAQGILESANGNSDLARKGNNHFGIKCHGWEGKKMYKDDDRKDECFRVYQSAEESYRDHSDFLMKYSRYAFLFEFESDDYKSWAKGLKKAGYATNPKYPQLLIDIIEDLKLDEYDNVGKAGVFQAPLVIASTNVSTKQASNAHTVQIHERGVSYVVVKKGDTFYKIAEEFDLTLSQLYRYNDFEARRDFLMPGERVFIQAKKRGNPFKKEEIIVADDMSVYELSQFYAVDIQSVKRLNGYTDATQVITEGEKVTLR